jgi:hypothetical protein
MRPFKEKLIKNQMKANTTKPMKQNFRNLLSGTGTTIQTYLILLFSPTLSRNDIRENSKRLESCFPAQACLAQVVNA